MEGGDLETRHRVYGGDLKTSSRQHGGFFWKKSFWKNLIGAGPDEMEKQMAEPTTKQDAMQRCGLGPLAAMAGMTLLPMLLGRGESGDIVETQMKTAYNPAMHRGGLAIPPGLAAKAIPLLTNLAAPLAMGTMASLGDNVMDKIFGRGVRKGSSAGAMKRTKSRRRRHAPKKIRQRASRKTKKPARQVRSKGRRARGIKKQGRVLFKKLGHRALDEASSFLSAPRRSLTRPETPFAQKIRQNINSAGPSSMSSAHIGPSYNI